MSDRKEMALNLIKASEGFRPAPYLDVAQVWTVGYGHAMKHENGALMTSRSATLDDVNQVLNRKGAADLEELLEQDYYKHADSVDILTAQVDLHSCQKAALDDFAFNLGARQLQQSTLIRRVRDNPYDEDIRYQFSRWVYAGGRKFRGLELRRQKEIDLYFSQQGDHK